LRFHNLYGRHAPAPEIMVAAAGLTESIRGAEGTLAGSGIRHL
jgi:hypothetical protein